MEPRAGAEEKVTSAFGRRSSPLVAGGPPRVPHLPAARAVVPIGAALIVLQLAYRAWATYGGYFLIDDFGFLAKAATSELDADFLFTPYGDHLQPLGFLIVWLVGQSEPYDWVLASSITLVIQALASTACFVFLLRLAGRTWRILIPLGFYLFSVVTLPGFMWWAAAIVQVPLQLAAFLALTAHLEFIRTGRHRYIVLTSMSLLLGMLCDVKIAFAAPALLFLSFYLNDGSGLVGRVRVVLAQWRAWLPHGLLFVGYLAFYLSVSTATERKLVAPGAIFDTMVRFALGPLFLGGPWRWSAVGDAPLPAPAPPEWAVTLAWVLIALVVGSVIRRHRPAAYALALLLVGVVVNTLMVSLARGEVFRGAAGLEVRYLGDLAPTLVLVVAFLAIAVEPRRPGEQGSHAPSAGEARATSRRRAACLGVATAAVTVGALVSSTQYVLNWHDSYPARTFFENVVAQAQAGQLRILDQQIPLSVIPREGSTDFETPSQVFTPLGDRVVAAARMNDPDVLSPEGIAYPARVDAVRQSPPGRVAGCGHLVDRRRRTIRLEPVGEQRVGDVWWASIAYLSSGDGVATLSFDGLSTDMEVRRGLHDYVFLIPATAESLSLQSRSDLTLCVDNVRVGTLEPYEQEATP